ncbi:MAG: DUF4140 domain-containing protein [Geminicoccaceae bacterium]
MFIRPAGLAALLLLPLASALAADIEGTSRIDAVTVYGNGAQVTRVVTAQVVSEGTHRVILTGLPLAMRQQSLRSRGGGESWTLGRVSLVERESSELVRERERELVQEVEALESQQRVRRDRIETEKRKLSFIQRLGDTAGRQIDEDLERGALDPSLWRESWEILGAGTAEALEAIRLAEEDLAHLQKRADRARRNWNSCRRARAQCWKRLSMCARSGRAR